MYEIFAAINFNSDLIFALAIQSRILDMRIISLILKMSAIAKFYSAKISGIMVQIKCIQVWSWGVSPLPRGQYETMYIYSVS